MPKKPRRTRSPHPGVVLIPPDPEHGHPTWRARYVDPDTGRLTKERIDPVAVRTVEARRDWAIRKSKAIAKRRVELESGAHRKTGTSLGDAIDRYYEDHPHLSDETLALYKAASGKLIAWAAKHGVKSADDLTGARLFAFRATLVKELKTVRATGGKRGQRQAVAEPRSPNTVNRELRSVGTILTYVRRMGLLPRLTSDDLTDGLQKLKAPPKRIDYRKPHELQKLLEAALRHDSDTFKATRAEHAGNGASGSTLRYEPIAPVVAAALITGLRFNHLLGLQWSDVDLEALDEHGRVVGEIVPQAGSQTKRTGIIGLEVSPALRRMLAAMHLKSGGRGPVFKLTEGEANAALKRLVNEYGAPRGCTWQAFRRTCGTYLTNAPGIFGSASAYRSARQLGHSVQVAERSYTGLIRGISPEARDLESAMQIASQMERIIESAGAPSHSDRETRLKTAATRKLNTRVLRAPHEKSRIQK